MLKKAPLELFRRVIKHVCHSDPKGKNPRICLCCCLSFFSLYAYSLQLLGQIFTA